MRGCALFFWIQRCNSRENRLVNGWVIIFLNFQDGGRAFLLFMVRFAKNRYFLKARSHTSPEISLYLRYLPFPWNGRIFRFIWRPSWNFCSYIFYYIELIFPNLSVQFARKSAEKWLSGIFFLISKMASEHFCYLWSDLQKVDIFWKPGLTRVQIFFIISIFAISTKWQIFAFYAFAILKKNS